MRADSQEGRLRLEGGGGRWGTWARGQTGAEELAVGTNGGWDRGERGVSDLARGRQCLSKSCHLQPRVVRL